MAVIPLDNFNLNRFWERTPTPLKYVLIFALLIATSYFVFSKKMTDTHVTELATMKQGIVATYQLIDNFEEFRKEQDTYNKEVVSYLENLHDLVEELNTTTNRKFDMILKSGNKNTDDIVEKILLLNESFEKISKVYQENIEAPDLNNNKPKDYSIQVIPKNSGGEAYTTPVDKDGNPTGKTIKITK